MVWFRKKRWRDYSETKVTHKQKFKLICINSLQLRHNEEHLTEQQFFFKNHLHYGGAILNIRHEFRENILGYFLQYEAKLLWLTSLEVIRTRDGAAW